MAKEKIEEKVDPEKSADADNGVKVPKKFEDIVKKIEEMSVLDLSELVKILEKKFGVSAAAPVAMIAAAAPVAPGAAPAEEKSVFNIQLTTVGEKKIDVIKVVRDVIGKGLKEAKDLVDKAAAEPQIVKENVKKEEAEDLKKKLEAAGAKVELK